MSIVNFEIPKTLEKRIDTTIKKKGFLSKAEFFRIAAMYFIDSNNETEGGRRQFLLNAVKEEVAIKLKGKNLPSAKSQLKNV
jgi:metal-responsive CopG/Arc/MetJ family transcriptional regulator